MRKVPRLWNYLPVVCTESYIWDTTDSLEISLESPPEHYQGGTGGGVLLILRVWRGRHWVSTRDWNLMLDSNSSVTGGQKHTHVENLRNYVLISFVIKNNTWLDTKPNLTRHIIVCTCLNDKKNDKKDKWDGHPDPLLWKLDPIWDYLCISDHNQILNSYGGTHGQSWALSPNFRYNMLYWNSKKELNTS